MAGAASQTAAHAPLRVPRGEDQGGLTRDTRSSHPWLYVNIVTHWTYGICKPMTRPRSNLRMRGSSLYRIQRASVRPCSEGDLLERCLAHYDGEVLLFVGEGRGGVNGGQGLFDALEREWVVERHVEVRPFHGGFERLWVLQRRGVVRTGTGA